MIGKLIDKNTTLAFVCLSLQKSDSTKVTAAKNKLYELYDRGKTFPASLMLHLLIRVTRTSIVTFNKARHNPQRPKPSSCHRLIPNPVSPMSLHPNTRQSYELLSILHSIHHTLNSQKSCATHEEKSNPDTSKVPSYQPSISTISNPEGEFQRGAPQPKTWTASYKKPPFQTFQNTTPSTPIHFSSLKRAQHSPSHSFKPQ